MKSLDKSILIYRLNAEINSKSDKYTKYDIERMKVLRDKLASMKDYRDFVEFMTEYISFFKED